MIYTPKTLRLVTARTFGDVSHDILAHADAWELESATMQKIIDAGIVSYNALRQRLEEADVCPTCGDMRQVRILCPQCGCNAALAAGESGKCV
jgi:hypothetical protein